MGDRGALAPEWLNLEQDVVNAEDLPLCSPRETLAQGARSCVIKNSPANQCLEKLRAREAQANQRDSSPLATMSKGG